MKINWRADHYLGYGECVTLFDTPGAKDTEGNQNNGKRISLLYFDANLHSLGRDYEHTLQMKQFLANEVKSVDIFLLLISGKDMRFDGGTQELLLWYEAVFGKEMWRHVVVEHTFWSHSEDEVRKRLENQKVRSLIALSGVLAILRHS